MLSTKRRLLRGLLIGTGIAAGRWASLGPGVYCFNFHRVGSASDSPFDHGVFSCDESQFHSVIRKIARRFRIVSLDELLDIMDRGLPIRETLGLITFDDGYRDNYDVAFPILEKLRVPAVFFLPTRLIDAQEIPWWDIVAWTVRNATVCRVRLTGIPEELIWHPPDEERAIQKILRLIKSRRDHATEDLISELQDQTGAPKPPGHLSKNLFMGWREAREMKRAGMAIGSHTHSHRILAQLPPEEQQAEFALSRDIIARELGAAPLAVSYPVGGRSAFSDVTIRLAEEAGYQLGFTFLAGVVHPVATSRFALPRYAVDDIRDTWSVVFKVGFRGLSL